MFGGKKKKFEMFLQNLEEIYEELKKEFIYPYEDVEKVMEKIIERQEEIVKCIIKKDKEKMKQIVKKIKEESKIDTKEGFVLWLIATYLTSLMTGAMGI